ncbi:MAG TPA: hypothetical protein ENL22_08555 [candidate division Zixibacteria bacterium]|nr:hypothetical protein [candidate division Zixibacteria bacterium]
MSNKKRLKSVTIPVSTFENAMRQFDQAAARLNIERGLLEFIKYPRRSIIVKLPVRMDDGRFEMFTGYRVQHSTVRGPEYPSPVRKYHKSWRYNVASTVPVRIQTFLRDHSRFRLYRRQTEY